MIKISYAQMVIAISVLWILVRLICNLKDKKFSLKRELQLLLVYICIVVVVRFTFCPFGKVEGKIQPLVLDVHNIYPFSINFKPFIYWFDYETTADALINLIGNTAMFVPLGVVWPSVFRKLNTHWKVIAAGVGCSLCIEILQLPFFDRVSDVDDLILNSLGFLMGYGVYLLVRWIFCLLGKKNRKICEK